MFQPEEIEDLRRVVRACARTDHQLLVGLRAEARELKAKARKIQPRSATAVSLVASDGGNNQLHFDPFHVQLVRVVDSYGKQLCLDAVSVSSDLNRLDQAQFHKDGRPRTPLGRMMCDLDVRSRRLNDLSHMMPDPDRARARPEEVPASWVQAYRDLCEWAVLYELICHRSFPTDTLVVRDGQLRSKVFRGEHFIRIRERIEEAIQRVYREDRRRVFLVGIAKRSKVLDRYNLAFALENVLPEGEARYVEIPREMERKCYDRWWDQRGPEDAAENERAFRFVAGRMYFVRFGPQGGDPIWSVDILNSQTSFHQEIFGYLQNDALEGFPVAFYPMCLQKAHSFAQIVDFDLDVLQNEVVQAIREQLPSSERAIFDALPLRQEIADRRYA
ncbi:MAG: hypothetical protein JO015_22290 [Verrucomicrobia bacterium]|nr:hypothetical protein [Verrucomicrobiota bacterium]